MGYSRTRLIHSVTATAANVHDSRVLEKLLHGGETRVWGDSAYAGQRERLSRAAPKARDFTQAKGTQYRSLTKEDRSWNRTKSRVRVKVEHAFGIIKHRFGFTKIRYRGLKKNSNRLYVTCALANIAMAERTLLARKRRRILQPQYAYKTGQWSEIYKFEYKTGLDSCFTCHFFGF